MSSRRILVCYQHKVRELDSCLEYKRLLEEIGGYIVDLIQIDFEWSRAVRNAKKWGIDAVVMPWLHHADNYALLKPLFDINPNLVVINLHHEQISTPVYEPLLLPDGDLAKNGAYHFAWGDYFASKLLECGVMEELVLVTGSMRTDSIAASAMRPGDSITAKRELAVRFGLDAGKRWLLFAENRGWIYKFIPLTKREFESQGVDSNDIDQNFALCRVSLEEFYRQVSSLDKGFFDNFELIYRPHPGTTTPIDGCSGIRVIGELPIAKWINCSDALLTWNSTAAYEAEISGVLVVRHLPVPCPERFDIYGMADFPSVKDLAEITPEYLYHLRLSQMDFKRYERFYGAVDGHATERVTRETIHVIERGMPESVHFDLSNAQRKKLLRKRLFEFATRISCATGLLQRIKWPRSAYSQLDDIPYLAVDGDGWDAAFCQGDNRQQSVRG